MSGRTQKAPKPTRMDAKHEAAHAVVAVRLGLPLASTDIKRRVQATDTIMMPSVPDGYVGISVGYTTLVPGTASAWQEALPDPDAEKSLKRLAVVTAAGVVAEARRGAQLNDLAHRDDLYHLVGAASVLGIGRSTEEPAVRQWLGDSIVRAEKVLSYDGGAAWDRVTAALYRKKALTGDEVRSLVGAEELELCVDAPLGTSLKLAEELEG